MTPERPARARIAKSIADRIDWTPTYLADFGERAAIVEQVLRLAEHESAAEVRTLRLDLAGVEGERDAADDFAASVRDLLDVADEPGWGWEVDRRIRAALAARTPRSADEVEQRFAYLANLDPGWDSYGAERIDPAAIATARSVLAALATPVYICATVEGGIMLAWDDENVTVEINPGGKLSASVGALCAEPEAAARTPQPAEVDAVRAELYEFAPPPWEAINYEVHAGGELLFEALGERSHEENSRIADVVVRFFNAVAPLPAVPDGEDADLRARWLAHVAEHGIGPGPVLPSSPMDGEDVPARLDAAAVAMKAADPGLISSPEELRRVAEVLRRCVSPDVRAAVAAAMARPTGGNG